MAHRYGPHDPATAPTHVTVGAGSNERQVPIPEAILRQRARINELAHAGFVAKEQGQQAALDAHPDDRAKVEAAIRRLAATGRPFSANDARALHGVRGGVVGATFTALRKERVIEPCGDETSTGESTHGHRIYRWQGVRAA